MAPSCAALGEKNDRVKSNGSSYPLHYIQTHFCLHIFSFAHTACCWNFHAGPLRIHIDFLAHERLSTTDSPELPTAACSCITAESTAGTEVSLPINQITGGQYSSWSLGIRCWIPLLPQRHFRQTVVVEAGYKQGHLIRLSC